MLGQRVTLRREESAYVVTVPLCSRPASPIDAEWRSGWLFVGPPDRHERRIRLTEGTGEQVVVGISLSVRDDEVEVVVPVRRVGVEACPGSEPEPRMPAVRVRLAGALVHPREQRDRQ